MSGPNCSTFDQNGVQGFLIDEGFAAFQAAHHLVAHHGAVVERLARKHHLVLQADDVLRAQRLAQVRRPRRRNG